jgi:imidazole glycerol-phosphate synthase subunit HisH
MRVGIINYGVGNLGSVARALEELKVAPVLLDRAIDMHSTDALILPGVGSFAECMQLLHEGGWVDALHEEVFVHGKPLLGVCLGMQLLADSGTEGVAHGDIVKGLGFIPGRVEHLATLGCSLRLPHVGWNAIRHTQSVDHLLANIPDETDFYFVHSYAFFPKEEESILAVAHYDVPFPVVVHKGNVWGTQFHPEKSSRAGFTILRNFIEGPSC